MPPLRAAPLIMVREPKTASASSAKSGARISGQRLGRVLAIAVQHDHDVEPVLDGQVVPGLLVAAVAEVGRLPDQGDRQVGLLLVAEADQVGGVLAVIVTDDHLFDVGPELPAGMRSSTLARVDAALYATTSTPILFFPANPCIPTPTEVLVTCPTSGCTLRGLSIPVRPADSKAHPSEH